MIGMSVRRFLAKKNVAGSNEDILDSEGDGNIISAGKVYIEIRPDSGIIRPEDSPVATYGLDLETVKEHGGVNKYFEELDTIPFKDTLYFKEYLSFWETDIKQKYRKIRESLKELNNFSSMVGKPQYGLREVNPGSSEYLTTAEHDFEDDGELLEEVVVDVVSGEVSE
jgi:hypothetical protein